jgi:hypothetical protein
LRSMATPNPLSVADWRWRNLFPSLIVATDTAFISNRFAWTRQVSKIDLSIELKVDLGRALAGLRPPVGSLADLETRWTAFLNDPAWHKVRDEGERDGSIVASNSNQFLTPTALSALK